MNFPNAIEVNTVREEYPDGTRIELIYMDDTQAPPPGTKGIVTHVDSIGQIHVNWETGSTLALVPGVDCCMKIEKEEEREM